MKNCPGWILRMIWQPGCVEMLFVKSVGLIGSQSWSRCVCATSWMAGGLIWAGKPLQMQNLTQLGAVLSISAERGKQCYSQFEVSGRSPSDQRSSQSFFEAGLACSSLCYRSQWNIKAFSGADQFMVFMASGRKKGSDTRIVAIMRGSVRFCISLFHFVRCLFKFTHFFYHCEDFLVKDLEQFFFFSMSWLRSRSRAFLGFSVGNICSKW